MWDGSFCSLFNQAVYVGMALTVSGSESDGKRVTTLLHSEFDFEVTYFVMWIWLSQVMLSLWAAKGWKVFLCQDGDSNMLLWMQTVL